MKKVLFSLLAVMMSLMSFAQDPVKTLTFPTYNDKSVGGYTTAWTATVDGETWSLYGFNNNNNATTWTFVRCGQKSVEQTATISTPAFAVGVSKIVYTIDKTANVTAANVTVKNGEDVVSTIDVTDQFTASTTAKEVAAEIEDGQSGYIYTLSIKSSAGSNGSTQLSKVEVYGAIDDDAVASPAFSVPGGNYYEAQSVEITTATEGATIQYSTDGETYADYTSAISITETTTLYAKALKGDRVSPVSTATYAIAETYASLTDLAQVTPANQPVIVTVENEPIKSIYVTSKGNRNGIYLAAGERDIEIYCYNVPEEWEAGGKVTGTVKGIYKNYNGTWEVCPDSWDCLTYEAPAPPVLQSSYPAAMSKVTEIPDNVILMFDQEINSCEAAAIQGGENDPIEIAAEKISIADGNSVYLNVADVKNQIEPGNVTVYAMVNGIETPYEVNFTLGEEFGIKSSTFSATGGQIVFNQSVDFVPEASTTVNVCNAKTRNIVTTAELSLDDDAFDAINVEFAEPIYDGGDYTVDIPASVVMSVEEEYFIGGSVEFTLEDTPLAATFDPADGTELASFESGDLITVTFNKPEAVGYTEWKFVDNNAENPDDAVLRTGMMRKNEDGSWYGKFYLLQKLVEGHTYTVTVYPYETEADMQAEADHNTYSNALGLFTATYTGTSKEYQYSPVTLVSIDPELGSELTLENNKVVVTFSDVVTLTAERNGGMTGDNTDIDATSEDGKRWTLTIPESVLKSTSGSLNINAYVKDAEGKVVKGNMGEEENSYFVWNFICYEASPAFTVTPAAGVVESIAKIRVSYEGGINESYATNDKIVIYKGEEVVYTFTADPEFDFEDITYLDYPLSTPITEPGTYKVVFPALYFSLGEEYSSYMSKGQTVEYTIEGTPEPEPATLVVTPEEGTVELLKEFTFTASDGSMIAPSSIEDGDIVIYDTFSNVVATITQAQLTNGVVLDEETYMPSSVVVSLDEAITADGVYTVVVPEGAFYLGEDMNPSEEMYLTYTIGEPKRFYVDPAEGVVESLSEIVMTWDTIVSVGPGKVTVKKDGEEVSQIDFFYTMDDPWNVVHLAYEATEPGTYTFEIPEGSLLLGEMGDEACEAITLTYTIEGPAEPDFVITVDTDARTITITPTDENAIYMLMGGYASDYNDEVAQALANEEAEYIPSADDLAEYASYGYYLQGTVLEDSPLGVLGIEDDGTYYIACATLAWDEALGKCVAGKVVSVTFTLEGTATGINSVDGTNNAIIKFIKDGKVMIKRGDSIFNTNGQQVK